MNITTRKIWNEEEINFLLQNYSENGSEYCANILNRKETGVRWKAFKLKIKVNKNVKGELQRITKTINNRKKYNCKKFLNLESPEFLYFLGYFWADGHLRKKTPKVSEISLVSEDAEYLYNEVILKISKNIWKLGNSLKKFHKNVKGINKEVKNQRKITTSSIQVYEFLVENDYINKSKMGFNKLFSKISEDMKRYFILGLFDGDGHFSINKKSNVYTEGQFVISASYYYDWKPLENALNNLNIEYHINNLTVPLGHTSRFIIGKKESLKKLYSYLYGNTNLGLLRKKEKFKNYINYLTNKNL